MNVDTLAYVALFAPLAAAVLITCFTLKSKAASTFLALGGITVSFLSTAMIAVNVFGGHGASRHEFVWLDIDRLQIPFGVVSDSLSVLMALIVTGVGWCIFLYSTGYMKGEDGYSRYFAKLSLFAFSMLGIVFSTNLIQTFMFWELVGVSSYALIGYYFHKPSAVDAGKKAFLTNRIGDFGMTVGIMLLFYTLVDTPGIGWEGATFSFHELKEIFNDRATVELLLESNKATLMGATLLIFTGAVAKSAQVPLHVWLPDAMEGPTPVSALMHAATMVAAGVYLVVRIFFMFAPYPDALAIVAWMGGITAVLAALMAFVQHDIKKVLAYSTLSQLGYMVLALGVLSPAAAMFHLTTHAFFKALLFLGSGSVIHGCHHEQDMRQMGGLMRKMPVTAWTFWIGTLALAGIFPFAGFWSKDAILSAASLGTVPGAPVLYGLGVLVALMTAAYMARCCILTFHGEYRGSAHPHESPKTMTIPLVILAIMSVAGGLLSLPEGFPGIHSAGFIEHSLMAVDGGPAWFPETVPEAFHPLVAVIGTLAALGGLLVGWLFYGKQAWSIDAFVSKIRPLHSFIENKFYFDAVYLFLVKHVQQRLAVLSDLFERYVLRGIVDAVAAIHRGLGIVVRHLLDGHLHRYVTLALVGVVVVLSLALVGM